MGSRGNRGGGGDRVLESRHVIGLFLLMLVFSGVFFALGYVMGRNQYDGQVRAESTPRATPDPVASAARRTRNSQPAANSANSSASSGSGWGTSSSSSPTTSSSRDSVSAPATATPDESTAPSSDWSFFSASKNPPDDRLRSAGGDASTAMTSSATAAGKSTRSAAVPNKTQTMAGSSIPAGSYVLQVAAMHQSADANAVANSLRAKKFPVLVVNPTTDKYYHVVVGPYHDVKSADAAKKGLESAGFKAIVKH